MVPLERLKAAHIKQLEEVGSVRQQRVELDLLLLCVLNKLFSSIRAVAIK